MFQFVNDVLMSFRDCFSREKAFNWFVVIVVGLMVRTDHLGVTSVIRALCLSVNYVLLIDFFRSEAWTLEGLIDRWCRTVVKLAPLARHNGAIIMVGDGVKQGKEGRKMPGVKRMHQESENTSKASYIFGHLFGGIGVVAESGAKRYCIPLALLLQDGVKAIFGWGDKPERQTSHVTELISLAHKTSKCLGRKNILLLDRLFLSGPALSTLNNLNADGHIMHIVTKAKSNCAAYLPVVKEKGKRGRPRLKGESVKVFGLFEAAKDMFISAEAVLYGKPEQVRYHCVDLLWGQKLYMKLRFVLAEYGGKKSILVSTDLTLAPLDIIQLYGRRFSIEAMFREMKQVIHAFCYRFWSKHMPKLNRFKKKTDPDPLESVCDPKAQAKIKQAVNAIEGFMFLCTVAMGLTQMIALRFSGSAEFSKLRWLRTNRNAIASEATVADFFQKNIFRFLMIYPNLPITRIIRGKQCAEVDDSGYPEAV